MAKVESGTDWAFTDVASQVTPCSPLALWEITFSGTPDTPSFLSAPHQPDFPPPDAAKAFSRSPAETRFLSIHTSRVSPSPARCTWTCSVLRPATVSLPAFFTVHLRVSCAVA